MEHFNWSFSTCVYSSFLIPTIHQWHLHSDQNLVSFGLSFRAVSFPDESLKWILLNSVSWWQKYIELMQLLLVFFVPFFYSFIHSFIQPYYVPGQECSGVQNKKNNIFWVWYFFQCRVSLHYFPFSRWGNQKLLLSFSFITLPNIPHLYSALWVCDLYHLNYYKNVQNNKVYDDDWGCSCAWDPYAPSERKCKLCLSHSIF